MDYDATENHGFAFFVVDLNVKIWVLMFAVLELQAIVNFDKNQNLSVIGTFSLKNIKRLPTISVFSSFCGI